MTSKVNPLLKVGTRVVLFDKESSNPVPTLGTIVEFRVFDGDDYESAIWKPDGETDELVGSPSADFEPGLNLWSGFACISF